jgi:hypothetical protein
MGKTQGDKPREEVSKGVRSKDGEAGSRREGETRWKQLGRGGAREELIRVMVKQGGNRGG